MKDEKKSPITSKSNKGDLCNSQNKDMEKKGIIDLQDLEFDSIKLNNEEDNIFPIDIFPKAITDFILQSHKAFDFHLDYLGAGVLSTCSTAIGNTCKLKLKEGYITKCNLYMVIIGRAGDGKTPSLNSCIKPLMEYDKISYDRYKNEMDAYKSGNQNTKPILEKILISDFTPEALIRSHHHNKRGLGIYVDELLSWIKNFNRYSNSGEAEVYLSLWSGQPVLIDRVGSESIRIDDTFINVLGGTQVGVLKDFFKDNRNENGFVDRLLFVYPQKFNSIKLNRNNIGKRVLNNYQNFIQNLIVLNQEPEIMQYTDEAFSFCVEWQKKRPDEYFFDYERAVDVKLRDHVHRFSIILQKIHDKSDGKVSKYIGLETLKKSIKLFEYFLSTAIKARENTIQKDYLESLNQLQSDIYNDLPKDRKFTTSEGIKIACKKVNGKPRISDRHFKTFLNDQKLFKRIKRGEYRIIL